MVAITESDCTGCDLCIAHCPFEALLPLVETPPGRRKRPVQVVVDHCVGCLSCIGSCPTGALYEVAMPPPFAASPLAIGDADAAPVERVLRWSKTGLGVA